MYSVNKDLNPDHMGIIFSGLDSSLIQKPLYLFIKQVYIATPTHSESCGTDMMKKHVPNYYTTYNTE